MAVLFNPEHCQYLNRNLRDVEIPLIDLSKAESGDEIVKASEDFGFFKVVNHGVPMEFIRRLETEAVKFFSLPLEEKKKASPPNPFGYGNREIGRNGDMGWVEYLLLTTNPDSIDDHFFAQNPQQLRYFFSSLLLSSVFSSSFFIFIIKKVVSVSHIYFFRFEV